MNDNSSIIIFNLCIIMFSTIKQTISNFAVNFYSMHEWFIKKRQLCHNISFRIIEKDNDYSVEINTDIDKATENYIEYLSVTCCEFEQWPTMHKKICNVKN